jgi:outer membrane immunogenic protein
MKKRRPYSWQAFCAVPALLACALGASMGTPAHAADLGVAPIYRAPEAVVHWTGSYIGISGGGAWGSAALRNDFFGDQTPRFDLHGGIFGGTSGFNFQNDHLVYGYESDASITGKRGNAFDFPPNSAFANEVREPWISTYRGRVGYAQDNWLLYATAGGALAGVENNTLGPPAQISEKHWYWGWTVGGGVEMRLTSEWSAKVEYLFVGLQDKSYFNPAPTPFASNQHVTLDDHVLRVGVNYKLPWSILDSFFKH